MQKIPQHITKTLSQLETDASLLVLECPNGKIDFMSNDYLGIVHHKLAEDAFSAQVELKYGATGSRLLAGNSAIHVEFEQWLADYYKGEGALVFNSGFVANCGIIDAIATRHDIILYDEFIHASLRDGCRISNALSFSFKHNNVNDLAEKIEKHKNKATNIYVLIESLYSMDGDIPDIEAFCRICDIDNVYLIVDEAHSTGIMGDEGEGLVVEKGLQDKVFLRIYTFGKAIGRKGAVVIADAPVINYLINRCRTFIYSTALSPMDILRIKAAMIVVKTMHSERTQLKVLSAYANRLFSQIKGITYLPNDSPIKPLILGSGTFINILVKILRIKSINARVITSPTVPAGTERIRLVLHSFNTEQEISLLYQILSSEFVQNMPNMIDAIDSLNIANLAENHFFTMPQWKELMEIY